MESFWDLPIVTSVAFHPRSHSINVSLPPNAIDGAFTSQSVSLGYRFYQSRQPEKTKCVILLFHGNAEIAPDYASTGRIINEMNPTAALLVVDYRGYGWSSGQPALTTLLGDAELVVNQLDKINGISADTPIILFGRSIGSQCAIHLATKFPERFCGLVIESGFHSILKLPMVAQMAQMLPGGADMLQMLPDIFKTLEKIKSIREDMPVLILHGDQDEIAPLDQGNDLHAACSSSRKTIKVLHHAGHNDLVLKYSSVYYQAVEELLRLALDQGEGSTRLDELAANLRTGNFASVLDTGRELLESNKLTHTEQLRLLELVAKASWHLDDMKGVIKYTTRLINRKPDHINGLCLRGKAFQKLNDLDSLRDDALTLSELFSGGQDSSLAKASLGLALLSIQSWNVD